MLSFQKIYHHFKRSEVVDALVARARSLKYDRETIKASIARYVRIYHGIDWELHGRLTHFCNRGVAHLTEAQVQKHITYRELRKLTKVMMTLADYLEPFAGASMPLQPDDLKRYFKTIF